MTPLGALGRGLLAGVAGTAAMTVWQELLGRLRSHDSTTSGDGRPSEESDAWEGAPAPAQVAKRLLAGLFQREVGPEHIGLLTNVTHWTYGTAWGGAYGLLEGTLPAHPLAHGLVFGTGVWAMSYVQLVPMGLYEPPWKYPGTLEIGKHDPLLEFNANQREVNRLAREAATLSVDGEFARRRADRALALAIGVEPTFDVLFDFGAKTRTESG